LTFFGVHSDKHTFRSTFQQAHSSEYIPTSTFFGIYSNKRILRGTFQQAFTESPLVTRERITDEHWALVQAEKEAAGYDREAYEHSLRLPDVFKDNSATIPTTGENGETVLLFRLGGLLKSAEKVKEVAGLEKLPKVVEGESEVGIVKFCVVEKETQRKLEEWLVQQAVLQK
jgi:hypothetical protein